MTEKKFKDLIWEELNQIKCIVDKPIERVFQEVGLTKQQGFIMVFICKGEIKNMGDISRVFDINQGNASTIGKRLETMGFLTRVRDEKDERLVNLFLTEKGVESMEYVNKRFEIIDDILEELPKEKREFMLGNIREVKEILSKLSNKI